MKRPTVILHAIPHLDVGGAERMLVEVLPRLKGERFEPHVCCLQKRGQLADLIEDRGIRVHTLGIRNLLDAHRLWRLWHLFGTLGVRILHAHLFVTEAVTLPVARMVGIPVVIATKHNEGSWMRPRHSVLERWLARQTRAFTATSEAVRRAAVGRGIPAKSIEVIYPSSVSARAPEPGADPESAKEWLGVPPSAPLVGVVGRFHPVKGHEVMLDAAASLSRSFPDLFFLFAGRGPQEDRIRRKARALGLLERLTIDFDPEGIERFLEAVDIFVMPSLSEGFPLTLLEAMRRGKPIVASAVGGIPEAVVDGQSGLLVPPGQPDRLAEAIGRLLEDPAAAGRLGRNARNRVLARFTVEQTCESLERMYDRLLGSEAARGGR